MSTMPGYWPLNAQVCGFWSFPMEWQFSRKECAEIIVLISSENWNMKAKLCSAHTELQQFLNAPASLPHLKAKVLDQEKVAFEAKCETLYAQLYAKRYNLVNCNVEADGVNDEAAKNKEEGCVEFLVKCNEEQ
ncbi:UDP-glucuronosyl/UDP-glucosyltransferase [Artemisia annua]|uniref:UDP-glucuronosyl/UDP-glucosyltransferase n=1 Tax=Artemisia annua TaxID=35608 RepID=A0A2U1N7U1_ARTAN|nr:UDP-glucuronosyl/UDP-glucosyltransferase [Artemisia annua]